MSKLHQQTLYNHIKLQSPEIKAIDTSFKTGLDILEEESLGIVGHHRMVVKPIWKWLESDLTPVGE